MKKSKNIWVKSLFVIYIIILVWVILFRMNFSISSIHRVRDINLIPFYYENVYEGDIPLFEAFLNLLIFVPFGIYLKMVGLSNKRIILSGFSLSLIFEISQYVFKLGATDITDLIANTFGTVVGLYAYVLLCRIIKNNNRLNTIIKIIATIFSIIAIIFFGLLLLF